MIYEDREPGGFLILNISKMSIKMKSRIDSDNRSYYGLKHLFKWRAIRKVIEVKTHKTMVKPCGSYGIQREVI